MILSKRYNIFLIEFLFTSNKEVNLKKCKRDLFTCECFHPCLKAAVGTTFIVLAMTRFGLCIEPITFPTPSGCTLYYATVAGKIEKGKKICMEDMLLLFYFHVKNQCITLYVSCKG